MPAEAAGYSARAGWRSAFQFQERRFRQTGLRQVGDAVEDIGEPCLGVDLVQLGGADERVHRRHPCAAAVGAAEQP